MKKTLYIFSLLLTAFLSSCDTNDDGFYNNVFVDIPNLVTIEPHSTTYTVGEKLYINADFSRYQNENGTPLDLFKTTGASDFAFSYVIEKQIDANTWEVVYVDNNLLDVVKGTAQNGSYVYGLCHLNMADNTYEYKVGFPLLSSGTYRLSFGYNSDSYTSVELRSDSPATRLILNINSLVSGIDSNGYYNFTVN
jgi:hypothetical protein